MAKKRKKIILHPIMSFVFLIVAVIIVSAFFGILGISTNYNQVNTIRGDIESMTVSVNNMFSLSGLKTIFSETVSNFSSFAPLSIFLITLIGIGIMDKSGFLQSFFTLITRKSSKFTVTFVLSIIITLASIVGDISFVLLIPIIALFFKYSKRNPKAGIVMSFAGLACGTGINIFINSIDSALLDYTKLAANTLDSSYVIGTNVYLFVMIIYTIIFSFLLTIITEKIIVPKLGRTEELDDEEFYLDNKKKRGLFFAIVIAIIYLLVFIYNIIPGLPLSGNLLDYTQNLYIDKLFGYNSFFNHGFVFVATILFFLCGLFYGIGAKTIKNNQDLSSCLSHSLDDIGKALVLLFFASTFISIVKASNIGALMSALGANLIGSMHITGIPLVLFTLIMVAFLTILVPSPVTNWAILSSAIVPVFMNAGLTPEFAQLVFRAGESITYGLTPVMAYFVIYLAYLDKYSSDDNPINMTSSIKNIIPYSIAMLLIWCVILIICYVINIPLGLGTFTAI